MSLSSHYPYFICIILMMSGFYTVMSTSNLIKKLVGLSLFQTSVLLLYICAGAVARGTPPVYAENASFYANPLPQVLMLTAIVVGVATLALGLALVVRIRGSYGTIEEDEVLEQDRQQTRYLAELLREEREEQAKEQPDDES